MWTSTKFIHSFDNKAPLQEIYSEAPPVQPRRYRSVLSNLQNALSLFIGRRRISKGSPCQVEGPTMENSRHFLVAVLARGTNRNYSLKTPIQHPHTTPSAAPSSLNHSENVQTPV